MDASVGHPSAVPRILVVDQNADMCTQYREWFAGCDIVEASDGRDALTKALVRPPSLVITEIALPLIDGAALCDILRADSMTRDVPILVVTSESRETEWARLRRAGADLVLHKEADRPNLRSEASRLLMRGKTLRERSSATFERAAAQIERSAELIAHTQKRRTAMSKAHQRSVTTLPPARPRPMVCPVCNRPLEYVQSHTGRASVRMSEQWDYYTCPSGCGTFQYRHSTRRLRRVP